MILKDFSGNLMPYILRILSSFLVVSNPSLALFCAGAIISAGICSNLLSIVTVCRLKCKLEPYLILFLVLVDFYSTTSLKSELLFSFLRGVSHVFILSGDSYPSLIFTYFNSLDTLTYFNLVLFSKNLGYVKLIELGSIVTVGVLGRFFPTGVNDFYPGLNVVKPFIIIYLIIYNYL